MYRFFLTAALICAGCLPATEAQTLIDLVPGPEGSFPADFAEAGEVTVFSGIHPDLGRELWVTDGTPDGSRLLRDIRPGSVTSSLTNFVSWDGRAYFYAIDDTGRHLWVSDGTEQGTHKVVASGGPAPQSLIENAIAGGLLFFPGNTPATGVELWATDGTEAGTRLVRNIVPGSGDSSPRQLRALGDRVVFSADRGSSGRELWISDGTSGGTTLVKDINPGSADSDPGLFRAVGDRILFVASTPDEGEELWVTDGTEAGTQLVADINAGPADSEITGMVALDDRVLFTAFTADTGQELWTSDGTPGGTRLVRDISPGPTSSDEVLGFPTGRLGAGIVFAAATPDAGYEPWYSDGTAAGTYQLADVRPGSASGIPGFEAYQVLGDRLYFLASAKETGAELWQTDGTIGGTVLTLDLNPGSETGLAATSLRTSHGALIAAASDGSTGVELLVLREPAVTSRAFTGAGTYRFGTRVGATLEVAGGGAQGSARISAERFDAAPTNAGSIPEPYVVPTRWVVRLSAGTLSAATFRIDLSTVSGAPPTLKAYSRPVPGSGSFTALATTYESAADQLVVTGVEGLGEIVLASSEPTDREPDAEVRGLALATAPNPTPGVTTVTLTLAAAGPTSVTLSDLLGRRVATLYEGPLGAGAHRIAADLSALPAGVYLVRAEAGGAVASRPLTVVR
ncbi:MAG: hypothetical protein CMM85_03350 [Rhodothermaceae bacterium]|nr:hypothetical protein [Rhodothermaceae bacterium]